MDAVVAGWAHDQGLAPFASHQLRPLRLWSSRSYEIGELGYLVHLHVGSLLTQFASASAEAGEEFAACASAGYRGGLAVVEDRFLLPFEGDATASSTCRCNTGLLGRA